MESVGYEPPPPQLLVAPPFIGLCLNLFSRDRNESRGETLYVCVLLQPFCPCNCFGSGLPSRQTHCPIMTVTQAHATQ